MFADATLLIGLLLLAFLLSFALIALLLLYSRVYGRVEKMDRLQADILKQKQEFDAKASEMASAQANELIKEASVKAQAIIRQAETMSSEVRRRLDTQLEQLPKAQQDIYRDVFKQVGEEAIQVLHQVADEMKVYADREVKAFGAALQERTAATQEEAKKAIEQSYQRMESEILAYKQKRLNLIDQSIHQVIREVTEEVLGKAIHTEQHQEIVIKALEDAKSAHVV